jgi:hypothetical protein
MMQRMQAFDLLRPRVTLSAMGAEVQTFEPAGKIYAAVSAVTGSTVDQNQALRISSTHRALTQNEVRAGDRFGGFVVDYVIAGTRYTQLFLTKEESL